MKNTMKAKFGFRVGVICNDEVAKLLCVYDGPKQIIIAEERTMEDYVYEVVNENNECAVRYGVFKTMVGYQYIYWGDRETDEDYLTKVTR